VRRSLAITELGCCAFLLLLFVVELKETLLPSPDAPPFCTYAPIFGVIILAPMVACFGVAGLTLYRRGGAWWLLQLGPLAVVMAAFAAFL
jgi:hypothetical protein